MIDEDADGLVDCADPDCAMFPGCIPQEICNNNLDDDGDMLIDCADTDCDTKVCGINGFTCVMSVCVCPGGATEMVCNDTVDNDCDGKTDCNDSDCTGKPACSVEICDNGLDEDGDMLIDCADPDCNMKACGMHGLTCNMNVCACPSGMTTEMVCNDMLDGDCDGLIDCADPDCAMAPTCNLLQITSVDYPVIAQGGTLVITGQGFTGATSVTIGGTNEMFTVNSNTQITVYPVADATPINMQNIIVTTPSGSTMPFGVTVIRLQINELDSDQPGTDTTEFIEVTTGGVGNVNLTGYSLIFFNGGQANDPSYFALALNGTTDATGMLLVGNTGVMPLPAITFANSTIQNGPDAAGIFQALPAQFPNNTPATVNRLIDVIIHETGDPDDVTLLDLFLGPVGDPRRVQLDEGTAGLLSIQRCGDGRNNGAKFATGTPTPGAANNVAACP